MKASNCKTGQLITEHSNNLHHKKTSLLHFVAFFHVASTGVDNKKVGVDNENALELTNSTVFYKVDNEKALELYNRIFFSYFNLISI